MQKHPAVSVAFELATDSIQLCLCQLATRTITLETCRGQGKIMILAAEAQSASLGAWSAAGGTDSPSHLDCHSGEHLGEPPLL